MTASARAKQITLAVLGGDKYEVAAINFNISSSRVSQLVRKTLNKTAHTFYSIRAARSDSETIIPLVEALQEQDTQPPKPLKEPASLTRAALRLLRQTRAKLDRIEGLLEEQLEGFDK